MILIIQSKYTFDTSLHRHSLTYIQAKTFSHIMAGKDVVGQARTGTGKTLGFALPLIELLKKVPSKLRGRKPRAIVMLPTRELAIQVRSLEISIVHMYAVYIIECGVCVCVCVCMFVVGDSLDI